MFRNLTFKVMNLERFKRLKAIENSYQHDVAFLQMLPESAVVQALRTLPQSKSQIRQDILALALSGFKENGFFVEFGATDGVKFSNSYLLEKDFSWQGILGSRRAVFAKASTSRAAILKRIVYGAVRVKLSV